MSEQARYYISTTTGALWKVEGNQAWWKQGRDDDWVSGLHVSSMENFTTPGEYIETDSTGAPLAGDASAEPIHKRVFEYDGAFWCRDCGAQWGALPGKPVMPDMCQQAAAPAASGGDEPPFVDGERRFKSSRHIIPLANCPCCGTEPEFVEYEDTGVWMGACPKCCITMGMPYGYGSRLDLCSDWNKWAASTSSRPPAPAPDAGSITIADLEAALKAADPNCTVERFLAAWAAHRERTKDVSIGSYTTPPAPAPDAGSDGSPRCPQCGGALEKVTQSPHGMLNSEQFDAVKAGDFLCRSCPDNGRSSNKKHAYFWESELPTPPAEGEAPLTDAEIRERYGSLAVERGDERNHYVSAKLARSLERANQGLRGALEQAVPILEFTHNHFTRCALHAEESLTPESAGKFGHAAKESLKFAFETLAKAKEALKTAAAGGEEVGCE